MDFELSPIFIPEELENVKLPSPELLSFYENLQERVIWIDDEIGDQLLQYSKYILKWNMEDEKAGIRVEDRKPIKLMILVPVAVYIPVIILLTLLNCQRLLCGV